MSETILTAENLKFRYDSEQPGYALNGVSMQVKRGEFVAVLGANGCGKSTLAKHFNAILLPEEGKVYVEGMDTADDDKLYDIRQTVGMVFQSPDNQIVATVVEEDVAFALENLGVPPEEDRQVRHGAEGLCPRSRAAGTGPLRAAGDEDLPQAAGDGRGRPGGRLHHPLRRQDDPGGKSPAGCRGDPRLTPE